MVVVWWLRWWWRCGGGGGDVVVEVEPIDKVCQCVAHGNKMN